MRKTHRWRRLLAAAVLVIASEASMAALASAATLPCLLRDPLSFFVQPGTTVWWFVLGGPSRHAPSSLVGIAFAAAANAAAWLPVSWLAVGVGRANGRMLAALRS